MSKINKIQLSGTVYDIQDLDATKAVELTQAQYNALQTKDPDTFYIITDASPSDISGYWTSAETESAITEATSGFAESSAVTEQISAAVSGKMDTSAFTAYSAATDARMLEDEQVTAAALNVLNDTKQDTLVAGSGITISGNVISSNGGGGITSGEVQTMIDNSISGKQDTLSAGTSISISSNTVSCIVDNALSSTSENPVQNKVIYQAIGDIETLLAAI